MPAYADQHHQSYTHTPLYLKVRHLTHGIFESVLQKFVFIMLGIRARGG